ncbi:hypothetical protein P4555_01290 [Peribacillus frigoritolerans]|uniref:hypothetical protein n=1 Tax=Peribacillus frigoritolerans TaxID=450367 RepID=UPI002E1E56CD|nr:hypothetical protein [Peribacillus frigoritolerans]
MNLCYLLVNLAVALVNITFTREFTRFTREFALFTREFALFTREFRAFTRDHYIRKSIEVADLEIQLRNCLRTGCHYLRCLDNRKYFICGV